MTKERIEYLELERALVAVYALIASALGDNWQENKLGASIVRVLERTRQTAAMNDSLGGVA